MLCEAPRMIGTVSFVSGEVAGPRARYTPTANAATAAAANGTSHRAVRRVDGVG